MPQSEKKNTVAAVVVTYNRLDLLRQCVEALRAQTASCDILIVDNASTDGTTQWAVSQTDVLYRNTGSNLGGAGGFNLGMRWAVEAGFDYVWVMDDDTLPQPDALEKLLEGDGVLQGNYGWLSSVALWTDGSECKMNRQKLKKSFYEYSPLLKYGLVQAEQATFVSLFLRSDIIHRFGFPIKEYYRR
ncbi:MAG: glycosyltransferase [Eubacteriales bacterium]|nr:glycosyltransferase [Eubacteriales bacterium]